MKNIIVSLIAVFLIGCKATQVQKVTINASKDDVWKVVSSLGDLSNYGGLDSSSIIPPGEATVGALVYVSQGKNYAISNVVDVKKNETIKSKLKETNWPVEYWNESWHLYDEGQSTGLKYVIDFKAKGLAKIGFPFITTYNKSDMKKTVKNIKNHIENK